MSSREIYEANWKEMGGTLKRWWPRLTDEELSGIAGDYEKLISLLQQMNSYGRGVADADFDRHMEKYTPPVKPVKPTDQKSDSVENAEPKPRTRKKR